METENSTDILNCCSLLPTEEQVCLLMCLLDEILSLPWGGGHKINVEKDCLF